MSDERLDPRTTALIVFDMQKGQINQANEAARKMIEDSRIVPNSVRLLATARAAKLPVFYIQNTRRPDFLDQKEVITDQSLRSGGGARGGPVVGTTPWEIIDELKPEPEDYVIQKFRHGAFTATPLDTLLRARGIDTIIVSGVRTTIGIETTCRDGRELGYNVVLASDATGGVPPDEHQWLLEKAFPIFSRVRTVAQIEQMLAAE